MERYLAIINTSIGAAFFIGPLYGGISYYFGGFFWTFAFMGILIVSLVPFCLYFLAKMETQILEIAEKRNEEEKK